uniref:Uncharacterized protein n=1 Tax=Oryza meridionalis TaxID=40149 RepID=A0A0E0EVI8_9ORYZ
MEVLGRQPCKREEEFGWGIVHPSSAHELFDEMSSPFEVYEEDIILVMKEEKVSRDEALRLLLEEWMDAKRKLEEKLNRVLEKFEEMEAHNGAEDATVIIKAATTDLREASSPTPKTSLSPVCFNENSMHAATSSSHNVELTALTVAKCLKGCSNHGVGAGSLMPTRCPTNCSSPSVIPDHTMATVVACATTSMAFMELVVGEEATCDTYTGTTNCPEVTHTKCSTLGLDVKGDTDQVMVAFLAQPCVFLLNMDNTDTTMATATVARNLNWFELYTLLSSELWQKPTGYKLMQSEATSGATYLISADWTITESCKLSYKITFEDGEVDVYWLNTKDQEFSYEQLIFHKEELATVWVYQSISFIKSKGSGRVVTIAASTSFTNSIPVPLASHVWKEFSWTLHYWNDGSVWKLRFCYMCQTSCGAYGYLGWKLGRI